VIHFIKLILRPLGIRRYKFEHWRYRFDCRFPTRFLSVWFVKPAFLFRWLQKKRSPAHKGVPPDVRDDVDCKVVKLAMILRVPIFGGKPQRSNP
jgi:hypothetical protein